MNFYRDNESSQSVVVKRILECQPFKKKIVTNYQPTNKKIQYSFYLTQHTILNSIANHIAIAVLWQLTSKSWYSKAKLVNQTIRLFVSNVSNFESTLGNKATQLTLVRAGPTRPKYTFCIILFDTNQYSKWERICYSNLRCLWLDRRRTSWHERI